MAKVRIIVRPTGCINGRDWPEAGEMIDLPDAVAEAMAEAGHVETVKVAAKPAEKVEKRPAPTEAVEKRGTRGRRNSG